MYGTSTASTTSSSRAVPAERRVRVVRLLRPRRAAPAFGFALRGGNEHSTGFFVSKVDFNSEAHLQGLKIGDQLVSVNGYRVDDAVHSELIHYLASQSRLKIKVRHVGMLPIREKPHEPLSWQFISEGVSMGSDVSSSPTICHDTERLQDLRLSILVPPRAKLGCGICKGPEWKPGIFVQFVREGGIAREAGLRPGDQIMSCNGHDFANIPFNEAVAVMKVIGRLELIVREGAGTELVSPESSGYNSSASSAAGERSPAPPGSAPLAPLAPPAALRRRLASVAEEAADRADRLTTNRLKRRVWGSLDFEWKNGDVHNFDVPSDIEPDYDSPSIPNNPNTFESKNNVKNSRPEYISSPSNRTIINLTEDGATIQCSYEDPKKTSLSNVQSSKEGKTIVVEVHHSNTQQGNTKSHCHPPPPKKEPSFDTASMSSSNTLSSAIADEIQRRKLLNKNSSSEANPNTAPPAVPKKPNPPKPDAKKQQHDALMDEFKKVHRKMFMNQENKDDQPKKTSESVSTDRQPTLPIRKPEKLADGNENHTVVCNGKSVPNTNGNHPPNSNGNHASLTDSPNRLHGVIATHANGNHTPFANGSHAPQTNGKHPLLTNCNHVPNKEGVPPPPPPPMPVSNGQHNGDHTKLDDRQKSIKEIGLELLNNTQSRNSTLSRTPTPDYNEKVAGSADIKLNGKEDKAELESLESYKLKSSSNAAPKPPSNYFVSPPNGTATMKKHLRPISVTIGEYACGGGNRKEPSKLEFLNSDKVDGSRNGRNDEPITNRLQSELALTLSRSNLRKKTDVTGDTGR